MIRLARALLVSCCAIACTPSVLAQQYPSKAIRWIVPYTPGGLTDNATRLVLQKIQEQNGWTTVVENRPGANSIVGAEVVARAPADGYTMLTVIAAHAANATLYAGKLPFDTLRSFAPVSLVGIAPLILTVNNDVPAKDVKELITYVKANPGKVSFGSSGVGAAAHLTTELLKQTAGLDMVHVPYKGTAPALQDLMAGNIQILVDVPSTLMPHVRSGKIRALAMFSSARIPSANEVPTIAEAGGPALESSTWVMFLAPADTPRDVVERLSSATAKAIVDKDLKSRFEAIGIVPVGSAPEQARQFLEDEIAKWASVIRTANVKAE